MKRRFLVLLSTLFALAAISLVIIQVSQMRSALQVSDNLFNISVNNSMDNIFTQLSQMKVEDYVSQKERYKLIRYRRIEEMNDKMQDIIRSNEDLFYDEQRVQFGISTQDSAFINDNIQLSTQEYSAIEQYNTLLNARNRLSQHLDTNDYAKAANTMNFDIDVARFNFDLLDSMIHEELIINGVDSKPMVGVLQSDQQEWIYCSHDADTESLCESAFRFNFHANGIATNANLYIVLSFPSHPIILADDTNLYTMASICMILLVTFLFILSIRTILSQRKLDEMKTDFINNMTHEIKTPLATISLACEMLKDENITSDEESRKNFVNIIGDENRRMRILIETLLQSAKMANKKVKLNLQEVNINDIITNCTQSFTLTIKNRQGDIVTDLGDINGSLFADELHLSNIIHNLIDNAIKYSPHNPHVTIKTYTEKGFAYMQISDNGIGISKEDQKHIFEKFYRVSTGNIHDVKGFGIGLNYVYNVVLLHKGEIGISSELGQGTTFTIKLPLL